MTHLQSRVVRHGAAGVQRHVRHGASLRHDEHLHNEDEDLYKINIIIITFMDCETWRPVSTAVFISSQLCDEKMVKKLQSY